MGRTAIFALVVAGFIALLAVAFPGYLRAPGDRAARPEYVVDIDGGKRPLLSNDGSVDLIFIVATDCPISNRYAPEIARICGDYKDRRVRCNLAYVDRDVTPAQVRQHQIDFKLNGIPAVIDSTYTVTDAAGARVTPEAAVFANGRRVYHGRIDDLNVELGKTRREATVHDVRLALDQALAGTSVAVPVTQAVGCYIERVK